jgi:hypothetical protein
MRAPDQDEREVLEVQRRRAATLNDEMATALVLGASHLPISSLNSYLDFEIKRALEEAFQRGARFEARRRRL